MAGRNLGRVCGKALGKVRRSMRRQLSLRATGLLGYLLLSLACDGHRPELANAVQAVASAEGAAVERTLVALVAQGSATLPFIEAGLHRRAANERFNLIVALRRLGLVESVPLLGQVASFDRDLRVAREAWETLSVWSSSATPRGQAARQALRKVDEQRGDLFDPVQLPPPRAAN